MPAKVISNSSGTRLICERPWPSVHPRRQRCVRDRAVRDHLLRARGVGAGAVHPGMAWRWRLCVYGLLEGGGAGRSGRWKRDQQPTGRGGWWVARAASVASKQSRADRTASATAKVAHQTTGLLQTHGCRRATCTFDVACMMHTEIVVNFLYTCPYMARRQRMIGSDKLSQQVTAVHKSSQHRI